MCHLELWTFVSVSYSNAGNDIVQNIWLVLQTFQEIAHSLHSIDVVVLVVLLVTSQQFGKQFGTHLQHVQIFVNDVVHSDFENGERH